MKKNIALITAIFFLLSISGCSYDSSYTPSSSNGTVSNVLKQADKQKEAIAEKLAEKEGSQDGQAGVTPTQKPEETTEVPDNNNNPEQGNNSEPTYEEAIVSDHIDGDTFYVTYPNGKKKKLRLIGIDTPETINVVEYFGQEASDYTKEHLLGKVVYLEKDVSETDQYERLLRYVWLSIPEDPEGQASEIMFNAILVKNGFAEAKRYPPDVKYMDMIFELQKLAKSSELGIWSSDKN